MVIPSTRKGNANNNTLLGNHNRADESLLRPSNDPRLESGSTPNTEWKSGVGDEVLLLNIGGMSFRIRMTSIFSRTGDERLVQFAQMEQQRRSQNCDAILESSEYFFERSPILFDAIFKYYATGQLHRPLDICPHEFSHELSYWKIPESALSACCWRNYHQLSESMEDLTHKKSNEHLDKKDRTLRSKIYSLTEGDGTLPSTLFTFGSICFVLISVIGLVLGSIKEFQVPIAKTGAKSRISNLSAVNEDDVIWEPHPIFGYVEMICIMWFTAEYLIRISVAPRRWYFVRQIMNIVDLAAIVPFFLELLLSVFGIDIQSFSDIKGALLVIRVLRVLRVVRILKLGRYSSGMRTFALTLKSSARQLGMMGMVLSTGVVFFSTLLYFVEKDEKDTPFTSIPAAFWWAIVTMTTVGYGDYVPVTIFGKLIASGAIISGVLVLALPITIIVDNFMKVSGNNRNPFSGAGIMASAPKMSMEMH